MSTIPAREYLDSLGMFGIKPGLEATVELMRRAGNPERDLRFIHLAGTNGKGSTGAMLECALRNAGYTTGFYSSPHLVDIRERFRVNGRAIPQSEFELYTTELAEAARRQTGSNFRFTYFEFTTVLAALIFARAGVDFVIWETGMGGRLDSTNVVTPVVSVITGIALDHQKYLGDTLEQIAYEKAGIIKSAVPVFHGDMPESVRAVLLERALALGAPPAGLYPDPVGLPLYCRRDGRLLQVFRYRGRDYRLPLPGAMQRRNFQLVYRVLEHLASRYGFNFERALDSLESVRWPGRCQELNQRILIDGGHNPDGIAALLEALQEFAAGETFTVLFAGFRDKEVRTSLKLLAKVAAEFVFVPVGDAERPGYPPEELVEIARHETDVPARPAANALLAVNDALAGSNRRILVAGSLYLAGEVLQKLADPGEALDLV